METLILDHDKKPIHPDQIPPEVRRQLEDAMNLKRRSKSLDGESKIISNEVKEVSLPILVAYGVKSYRSVGLGTFYHKVSKGSSINAGKLRETLLLHGIAADDISAIIEESSNSWERDYVEFKEDKQ